MIRAFALSRAGLGQCNRSRLSDVSPRTSSLSLIKIDDVMSLEPTIWQDDIDRLIAGTHWSPQPIRGPHAQARISSSLSLMMKRSMRNEPCWTRYPGDAGQRFANLRLPHGYMYSHHGKKWSSWAESSASGGNGTMTPAWIGISARREPHRGCNV